MTAKIGGAARLCTLACATAGATLPGWFQVKGGVASELPWFGRADRVETVQFYPPNWADGRIDPEVAAQWEQLPALAEVGLRARIDSLLLQVDLPLRRDLDAWRRDPMGGNLPLGSQELDINAPYEGWAQWRFPWGGQLQAGRFPHTFSWSDHGVVLGSRMPHDAVHLSLPIGVCRFESFWSSLDPWLVGTRLDGTIDTGSEADLQQVRTVSNQKGRVYTEPSKSLFVHRLTVHLGAWDLAISEVLLVGGRTPSLREALPLVVWHNNYGDGYSKVSTALQARFSTERFGAVHSEVLVEDIRVPSAEVIGVDPRTVYGANLGWRLAPPAGRGGFGASLDGAITSATFNNHTIPLLKGVSRRRYRSNNRDQAVPGFVDQWIVDRPLGYHRGSDAADLWGRLEWVDADSSWGGGLELDWLNQGDAAVWKDAELFARREGPLSGDVTTEGRILVDGWWAPSDRWWDVRAQAGVVVLSEPGREPDLGPALSARIGWRLR